MRFVFVAGAASFLLVLATFACSSSTPAAATDADSGSPPPIADDTPAEEDAPEPSSSSGDPTSPDDGGAGDADAGGGGGSTGGDGGVQCRPDSIRESETNDTEANADVLAWKTGSYCGRLDGEDVDVLSFTIPNSQNGFQFTMNRTLGGGYKVECSVDGDAFAFDGTYPYVIGKPYFCRMTLTASAPVDYRIDLTVTPN